MNRKKTAALMLAISLFTAAGCTATKSVADSASSKASDIKSDASSKASDIKSDASSKAVDIRSGVSDITSKADEYAKEASEKKDATVAGLEKKYSEVEMKIMDLKKTAPDTVKGKLDSITSASKSKMENLKSTVKDGSDEASMQISEFWKYIKSEMQKISNMMAN